MRTTALLVAPLQLHKNLFHVVLPIIDDALNESSKTLEKEGGTCENMSIEFALFKEALYFKTRPVY